MDRPLRELLFEHLEGAREAAGARTEELESVLETAVREARAAWPEIAVPTESFVRFLAERVGAEGDVVAAVGAARAADLYLACACAGGDARAIATLEAQYLSQVDAALARMNVGPDVADEVKQILRTRLFVSEPGARPKIADYSGRGDLKSWLRAAAVRAAFRVVRKPKGLVDVGHGAFGALPSPGDDVELDYLKRTYAAEFRACLAEAFGSLGPRERNLLRHFFGQGLTVDEVAPLYRVHRATVARWIAKARDTLVQRTRDALVKRLNARPSEVASLLRLIRSELDASLRTLTRSIEEPSA
jgi:RNA polymerase sigma-70 factor (ECF subfamily)